MDFYINKYHFFAPKLHSFEDWKNWAAKLKPMGDDDQDLPNVDFIPSMQRRKLSQSIKETLYVANSIASECKDIASVYSSRFGEWEKTSKQLEKYHNEKEVSPTAFGLSVHNAAIGMFSLLQENNKSYTSISGNEHSFDAGLIEAIATLAKEDKVLYISSEERVPDLYKSNFPEKTMPLAIGLIISKNRLSKDDTGLEIEFGFEKNKHKSNFQHSLDFITFLLGEDLFFEGKNYKIVRKNG